MKWLNAIQLTNSHLNCSVPACQNCAHFKNDPAHIEEAFRGLTTMSSGFASVRDQDGICQHHQLYLSARDSCPDYLPTSSATK
jgi:hypothetical protein